MSVQDGVKGFFPIPEISMVKDFLILALTFPSFENQIEAIIWSQTFLLISHTTNGFIQFFVPKKLMEETQHLAQKNKINISALSGWM